MDRTRACGARNVGSIPTERTSNLKKNPFWVLFCFYLVLAKRTREVKRDFWREAVFDLITPRFAALSIA